MRNEYKLSIREKKYFCITIPVEYVENNQLQKGYALFFYLENDSLIISDVHISGYEFLGTYKLSKKGKRGWVTSAPTIWIKQIKGKKDDILSYSLDTDYPSQLIITRR